LTVWYLTFNCDLDLELTHGQHGFCTSPCWGEHLSPVWRKSFNYCRTYRADTTYCLIYDCVRYLTFNCDLDLELTHGQHEFCTSPCWSEHLSQVWRKSFKWYRSYRADTKMETDGRTYRPTRQSESIMAPPTFCGGGIISNPLKIIKLKHSRNVC
jgi:hypothetical protein